MCRISQADPLPLQPLRPPNTASLLPNPPKHQNTHPLLLCCPDRAGCHPGWQQTREVQPGWEKTREVQLCLRGCWTCVLPFILFSSHQAIIDIVTSESSGMIGLTARAEANVSHTFQLRQTKAEGGRDRMIKNMEALVFLGLVEAATSCRPPATKCQDHQ